MDFRELLSSMFGKDKDIEETAASLEEEPGAIAEDVPADDIQASEVEKEIEQTAEESLEEHQKDDSEQETLEPGLEADAGGDLDSEKELEPKPEFEPESEPEPESEVPTIPKGDKPVEVIQVPNPMCGVEYVQSLEDLLGEEEVLSVVASDDLGDLLFDTTVKTIYGRPFSSRDFWMEIELATKVFRLQCFVNENPRSLWKDIPSDQTVKPDKDYKAILSPDVDLVAVSYRGRSHANRGSYRDDDFFIGQAGRFNLSIVADGAGSAPLSSTGSKVFCQQAGTRFTELVSARQEVLLEMLKDFQHHSNDAMKDPKFLTCLYEILPAAALFGRGVLTKLATERQVPLKQFHTTALLSFSVKIEEDSYFCAAFQIGDGITAVMADQQLQLLGSADAGNFPGETVFVTSNGVFDDGKALLKRIHCFFSKAKPTLLSMTDGITDSYFKENPSLTDVTLWQRLLDEVKDDEGRLKPAEVVCDWLNYYVEQEHDDRTLSLIMYK